MIKTWVGLRVKGFSTPCAISYVVNPSYFPYGGRVLVGRVSVGRGRTGRVEESRRDMKRSGECTWVGVRREISKKVN